ATLVVSCFGGGAVSTSPNLIGTGGQQGFGGLGGFVNHLPDAGNTLPDGASPQPDGGMTNVPAGLAVGEDCSMAACRMGLDCVNDQCQPSGSQAAGDPCVIGPECANGLRCLLGECTAAGAGQDGDTCKTDADCDAGLRCGIVGLALSCTAEGTVDVGGACMSSVECYSGLACDQGACTPDPTGLPVDPAGAWTGVTCEDPPAADADSRAYFELPGVNSPAGQRGDYFRLPFPNDARVSADGTLDLADFPTPGPGSLGVDAVKLYVDAINGKEKGWGTSPTVIFRFSNGMDFNTFNPTPADAGMPAGPQPIQWVDVTPGADEYGLSAGFSWFASGGRTKYVCYNYLAVRRPDGSPLLPGHTYAVFLRKEMLGGNGNPVVHSPQFDALLKATAPADATLKAAYAKYAPFRDYLKDQGIPASDIINAAVITAAGTRDIMSALADAVQAAPKPTASGWVRCDTGVASPCPQAEGNRACGAADPAFDEYHALVKLPIFQQGTAPYKDAGGNIVTDAPVRTEEVCMALAVPKGVNQPAAGWPLVVFGHGTGGSFRDAMNPGVAGALANIDLTDPPAALPDGGPGGESTVHFAVLGYDAVEHGPRRGTSTDSPDNLFFNFLNPDAARGNPLQGAADIISIGRFAQGLSLTAAQSGGDAIAVDPERMVYFGHSQGGTHGSLALPYADMYKGAVLSGNGASIIHALLHKTSPVNIAQAVPFMLQDPEIDMTTGAISLAGGESHPALTLIGQWIDPADPLNFARYLAFEPLMGHTAKHLFQTYGQGDTFAPPITMRIYALAAQVAQAKPHASVTSPDDFAGMMPQTGSVAGNRLIGNQGITIGLRQYKPSGSNDGHFVAFDVPDATIDVLQFLGMTANGQVPKAGITAD
ncbi:MAG TPA: hypothetical protein VL137_11855, partial [Polyangiaceae bacterium]|nr:hypothetical protein [Polyangiaceae bacterium]